VLNSNDIIMTENVYHWVSVAFDALCVSCCVKSANSGVREIGACLDEEAFDGTSTFSLNGHYYY
jgi:hypothetical protein